MSDPFTDAHSWADVMYGKDMGDALRRDAAALAAKDAEIERLREQSSTNFSRAKILSDKLDAAEAEIARWKAGTDAAYDKAYNEGYAEGVEVIDVVAIVTERERCARVAEEKERETDCFDDHGAASAACSEIAAAIRAG